MPLNDPREQSDETAGEQSFADILNEFESATKAPRKEGGKGGPKGRGRGRRPASPRVQGTVVGIAGDSVLVDYGAKSEGVIHAGSFRNPDGTLAVQVGDTLDVSVTGFDSEGMAKLSRVTGPRPRDWEDLTLAYNNKAIIAGRVTGTVKGGFTVDVGVRAFLPASRCGVRDAAEMDRLVGQEIRCRVIKLDVDDEDVVIDRRSVMEEEAADARRHALETLVDGAVVRGTVRSLAPYGAFVDIGGVDGLLHVGDISWTRVTDPSTELSVGDVLELKVLKVDQQSGKISLGLKQMSPDPWDNAAATLKAGDRISGNVARLTDFGAFVEVIPGVEGLIHVSEMSWTKRVQRASDILKKGERVEAIVLKIDAAAQRLSLGLKQVLENPWDSVKERYPSGKIVEGKVTRLAKFGAFVELEEGVDGLVHISELTGEKRVQNPGDVVKVGQVVRAIVLSADTESKRLKLSMKQLEATAGDEFAKDAAVGDQVTGRIITVRGNQVRVQLGEGVEGICILDEAVAPAESSAASASLAEQLAAAWKGGSKPSTGGYQEGELRPFKIKSIDPSGKKIELIPA